MLGGAALTRFACAQQGQNRDAQLHVLPVQGNVSMLVGAGGNIAVQTGKDGVLLVDTGLEQNADKVLATIREMSKGTIRYIIDTHVHPDHIGGNEKIAKAGKTIAGGNVVAAIGESAAEGATIIAHEAVLNRIALLLGNRLLAPKALGRQILSSSTKKICFSMAKGFRFCTERTRTPTATAWSFSGART